MTSIWAKDIPELQDAIRRMKAYPEVVALAVTCPKDHALVRALNTETGVVLLWQTTGTLGKEGDDGSHTSSPVVRQTWCGLRRSDDDPHGHGQIEASCPCTSGCIDTIEIWAALDAGKRRVRVRRHPQIKKLLQIEA